MRNCKNNRWIWERAPAIEDKFYTVYYEYMKKIFNIEEETYTRMLYQYVKKKNWKLKGNFINCDKTKRHTLYE